MKNQKGFTLIEILVVVIIVAILAAIAVPIYMRYVEKARAAEAQSAISSIRKAFDIYRNQFGTTEDYTVEDALMDAQLGESTLKNWEFEVIGSPPKKYIATSTSEFSAGEGHQVHYDVEDAAYHGYGVDEFTDEEEE
ncbi:MAG: prepilin-type N-terminal cleavage/methylation domain-containing protein [Candidatus Cloacimonetes bacterium]|nr:prepilin-type N-terminal cleavage/methylation domain-containing protein [Candidatus Cloacimonadota bacterium]